VALVAAAGRSIVSLVSELRPNAAVKSPDLALLPLVHGPERSAFSVSARTGST